MRGGRPIASCDRGTGASVRGEIWWADLPACAGSGPGFRRPVLVVQSPPFNASRIQTVVVLALSSNLRLQEAPGNVLIPSRVSCLPKDSVANVSQILTLDKAFLTDCVGTVPTRLMHQIDEGLRLVLDL